MVKPIAFWQSLAQSGPMSSQSFSKLIATLFLVLSYGVLVMVHRQNIGKLEKSSSMGLGSSISYALYYTSTSHVRHQCSDQFLLRSTLFIQTSALSSNQLLRRMVHITRFNVKFLAGFIFDAY